MLAVHHVTADFWSLAVLARELGAFYTDGENAGVPETALHYTDFARWQERRLAGPWGEGLWEHWRGRLTGAPPLDLATDRPRPPAQTFRGAERRMRLGADLAERLQALAAVQESTLFVALLAAWQALLGRHAGQDDFLVGSPTTGRSAPGLGGGLAGVVGYFVNLVALRADLAGDPTVLEMLERARGVAFDALEHEGLPFALLAERLQPERDASRPPLASTVLALQRSPSPDLAALAAISVGEPGVRLDLGRLSLEAVPLESPAAQFDLTLFAAQLGGDLDRDLILKLEFNTDLFDGATAERMLARMAELLRSMTANPARRLSELDLLPEAERRQLLAVGATGPGRREGTPIHQVIEGWAARTPERLAVADSTEALTYGELNARANRLARRLRGLGIGPETTVAVCLERSAALVVAELAALKAGAAYAPLDPSYPAERLAYLIADSAAPVLLTRRALLGDLPAAGTMICVDEALDGDSGRSGRSGRSPQCRLRDLHLRLDRPPQGGAGRPRQPDQPARLGAGAVRIDSRGSGGGGGEPVLRRLGVGDLVDAGGGGEPARAGRGDPHRLRRGWWSGWRARRSPPASSPRRSSRRCWRSPGRRRPGCGCSAAAATGCGGRRGPAPRSGCSTSTAPPSARW